MEKALLNDFSENQKPEIKVNIKFNDPDSVQKVDDKIQNK